MGLAPVCYTGVSVGELHRVPFGCRWAKLLTLYCEVWGPCLSSSLSGSQWRCVCMRSLSRAFGWLLLLVLALIVVVSVLHLPVAPASGASPAVSPVSRSVSSLSVPTSASRVIGSPSLSASFIDRVLATYHSPAVGLGQALYADSQQFQIDDAHALAFFLHESSFGTTGVARYTRSLGNIICSGYPTCFAGFRSYASWQAGAWDWFRLIKYEYLPRGLVTVEQIVPVYAPASDGNTPASYIAAVLQAVSLWRAGRIEV